MPYDTFTHRALVDEPHRVYQYFSVGNGGVTEWGLSEQCGNGCNQGFELERLALTCAECGARYSIEECDDVKDITDSMDGDHESALSSRPTPAPG